MLNDKKPPPEIPTIQEQLEEEKEFLLLKEIITMDSSSSFNDDPTTRFSNLRLCNQPPCFSCGCNGNSVTGNSSASLKRPSSLTNTLRPNSKKPNIKPTSLFGFSKIPLPTELAPNTSPSNHFLRRCNSDPCDPLPTQVSTETPESPQSQNANIASPGTPLSASKFPPMPSTLRQSGTDPNPSPAPTFSSSCDRVGEYDVLNAKWARKFSNCMEEMTRRWEELLGFEEDKNHDQNDSNSIEKRNGNMDNCEEDSVEAVTVEMAGDCLIIHFKCPCGRGYQILLSGKNCYYKLL